MYVTYMLEVNGGEKTMDVGLTGSSPSLARCHNEGGFVQGGDALMITYTNTAKTVYLSLAADGIPNPQRDELVQSTAEWLVA